MKNPTTIAKIVLVVLAMAFLLFMATSAMSQSFYSARPKKFREAKPCRIHTAKAVYEKRKASNHLPFRRKYIL